MASRAGLFFLVFLFSFEVDRQQARKLIVWNVGQGQWVTASSSEECWHFDMGGERAPWTRIMQECRAKKNRVAFSHWDWDHISFAGQARYQLPDLCLWLVPAGPGNAAKKRVVLQIPTCEAPPLDLRVWQPRRQSFSKANDFSRVFQFAGVLIPGDSPSSQEKIWSRKLLHLEKVRWLVLGHHGSRTSTSRTLLRRLSGLRLAISSSRYRRYGHPHSKVIRDLEKFKVPLITTEDWGTIEWTLD